VTSPVHQLAPPIATAVRPSWHELPEPLREGLADRLGRIASAEIQTGGFTPGLAARLRLASGQQVFTKGIPADHALAGKYRAEATTARQLPETTPAPRLRWVADIAGWVILAFDDIDGRHVQLSPGSPDIGPVVATIARLAKVLTPCPVPDAPPATSNSPTSCTAGVNSPLHHRPTWTTEPAATSTTWPRWKPIGCPPPRARPCCTATSTSQTCSSTVPGR
jgi:hypothetical protein